MKTAILGGSFNPPHLGHISLAQAVHDIGYARVVFIPAFRPPHKNLAEGADDADRLAMLELAVHGLEWAEIWDGEIRRGGKSYSIDTVRALKAAGKIDGRPGLIIGDDLLSGFSNWRESEKLKEEAQIIVARRFPEQGAELPPGFIQLQNPLFSFTSTEIREQIHQGNPIASYVPEAVAEYIEKEKLYASPH